jgi:very-short-patch-repair endonuclease
MDFLLLLPENQRVVIEIDGKQHYCDDEGRPSPRKYAEMMAEDRRLRLAGYEVFRFGAAELVADPLTAAAAIRGFISDLFARYHLGPYPSDMPCAFPAHGRP